MRRSFDLPVERREIDAEELGRWAAGALGECAVRQNDPALLVREDHALGHHVECRLHPRWNHRRRIEVAERSAHVDQIREETRQPEQPQQAQQRIVPLAREQARGPEPLEAHFDRAEGSPALEEGDAHVGRGRPCPGVGDPEVLVVPGRHQQPPVGRAHGRGQHLLLALDREREDAPDGGVVVPLGRRHGLRGQRLAESDALLERRVGRPRQDAREVEQHDD
jgi:hypothetical protein